MTIFRIWLIELSIILNSFALNQRFLTINIAANGVYGNYASASACNDPTPTQPVSIQSIRISYDTSFLVAFVANICGLQTTVQTNTGTTTTYPQAGFTRTCPHEVVYTPPARINKVDVYYSDFCDALKFSTTDGSSSPVYGYTTSQTHYTLNLNAGETLVGLVGTCLGTDFAGCSFMIMQITGCLSSSECPLDLPICSGGTCHACASNAECLSNTEKDFCVHGICYTCPNQTCPTSKPFCINNKCHECSTNAECPLETKSYCNSTNTCAPCVANLECSGFTNETYCDIPNGKCVNCLSNPNCSRLKPNCEAQVCSSCVSNSDCTLYLPQYPYCSPAGPCVTCISNQNCTLSSSPRCFNDICGPCTSNNDCINQNFLPYCSVTGSCVNCTQNQECISDYNPRCDSGNMTCSPCITGADCTFQFSKPFCHGGACVKCTNNEECISPDLPKCQNYECSKCISSADCLFQSTSHGLPYCNSTGSCVICVANINCTTPGLPYCNLGHCVQCISNLDCLPSQACYNSQCNDTDISVLESYTGLATATRVITISMIITGVLNIGQNPTSLLKIFNTLITLFYLLLIDVNYPILVKSGLRTLQLSMLFFLPTLMTINVEDSFEPSDPKVTFLQMNTLFVWSTRGYIGELIYLFLIFFVCYVLQNSIARINWISKIFRKIYHLLKWNGIIRGYLLSFLPTTVWGFIQMTGIQVDTFWRFVSSLLSFSFVILNLFAVYLIFNFLKKGSISEEFKALKDDIKKIPNNMITKLWLPINLVQQIWMSIAYASLTVPYLQITMLLITCCLQIFAHIKFDPLEKKADRYLKILQESCFSCIYFLAYALAVNDEFGTMSATQYDSVGVAIVVFIFIILVPEWLLGLWNLFSGLREKLNQYHNRKAKSKLYHKRHFRRPTKSR